MVYSVKTFNNINQVGLKELGNHFQIDGDLAENPDAYILRSQNLHISAGNPRRLLPAC